MKNKQTKYFGRWKYDAALDELQFFSKAGSRTDLKVGYLPRVRLGWQCLKVTTHEEIPNLSRALDYLYGG